MTTGANPGSMPRSTPGNMPKRASGGAPASVQPRPQPARPTAKPPTTARTGPTAEPQRDPRAAGLPDKFVNPYTFVPFPDRIRRGMPTGHAHSAAGNLSGALTVRLTARSRILVRGGPDGGPPIRAGVPIIPGSSFHGALRSLHEALCGGCLRVFDRAYLPAYRDSVTTKVMEDWKLAVVDSVDIRGRPLRLTVCSDLRLAKHHVLATLDARTGMRLSVSDTQDSDKPRPNMKIWRTATPREDPNGEWVLLLSDGSARQVVDVGAGDSRRKETRYYAVFGRLAGGSEVAGPDDDAWRRFELRARGARDLEVALRRFKGPRGSKVDQLRGFELSNGNTPDTWPYEAAEFTDAQGMTVSVGKRLATRPWCLPGQPIWVKLQRNGNRVTDLKVSMVWRHLGTGTAGERVPEQLLSCDSAEELCPTCQVFGSADTTEREEAERAVQQSYRGHVRVGDLIADGLSAADLEPLVLAPLSAPRAGSGQFYLAPGQWSLAEGENVPLREWGSAADQDSRRQLRGRKRYWATSDPERHQPRWRKRTHQSQEMSSDALAFPVGTVLTGRITFDNLRPEQVGSLVAALDPRLALQGQPGVSADDLVFTLGGGKPFGFGACKVQVEIDWLDTAEGRWGAGGPAPPIEALLEAFLADQALPRQTWPALAAACQFDRVDPELVWYPPGARWAEVGTQPFDEGYTFWQKSEGRRLRDEVRPLKALPDPAAPAEGQQLDITLGGGGR